MDVFFVFRAKLDGEGSWGGCAARSGTGDISTLRRVGPGVLPRGRLFLDAAARDRHTDLYFTFNSWGIADHLLFLFTHASRARLADALVLLRVSWFLSWGSHERSWDDVGSRAGTFEVFCARSTVSKPAPHGPTRPASAGDDCRGPPRRAPPPWLSLTTCRQVGVKLGASTGSAAS